MRPLVSLAALAALAALGAGARAEPRHEVARHVALDGTGWLDAGAAAPADEVRFVVALPQPREALEALEAAFWRVSDPQSREYQQFRTRDEVLDLVRAEPRHVRPVRAWLAAAGVPGSAVRDLGDALDVRAAAPVAARLFAVPFRRALHARTGARRVRPDGACTVPRELAGAVELVAGLAELPEPPAAAAAAAAAPASDNSTGQTVVPQTLWSLYGVPRGAAEGNHSVGIVAFDGMDFAPSDLAEYGRLTGLALPAVAPAHIKGGNDPSNPGYESTLDIELVTAVGLGATPWYMRSSAWVLDWVTRLSGEAEVPDVASISFAWGEALQCADLTGGASCRRLGLDSAAYVRRTNVAFQKMGLRGVSLVTGSGDAGAPGHADPQCNGTRLLPAFPASSPFITTAGGTQLDGFAPLRGAPPICAKASFLGACASGNRSDPGAVERVATQAASGITPGGGFSNDAARPAYQRDAVEAYFASGPRLPPATFFNRTGRGYPDVAAIACNMLVYRGSVIPIGGTSVSSPTFAGVASRLVAASRASRGRPLGFLNPLLYQAAAARPASFHDVTVGHNRCTERGCHSSCQGFDAVPGWDPVTGLGSPSFPDLLAHLETVPLPAARRG